MGKCIDKGYLIRQFQGFDKHVLEEKYLQNVGQGTGISVTEVEGLPTIAHGDTSTQASSENSGRTYIQSITLDDYGHITGLSTASEVDDITYFSSKAEWEAAAEAGELDADKYYSYPEANSPAYETKMTVAYEDGTTKDYIIYCKEV